MANCLVLVNEGIDTSMLQTRVSVNFSNKRILWLTEEELKVLSIVNGIKEWMCCTKEWMHPFDADKIPPCLFEGISDDDKDLVKAYIECAMEKKDTREKKDTWFLCFEKKDIPEPELQSYECRHSMLRTIPQPEDIRRYIQSYVEDRCAVKLNYAFYDAVEEFVKKCWGAVKECRVSGFCLFFMPYARALIDVANDGNACVKNKIEEKIIMRCPPEERTLLREISDSVNWPD